MIEPSYLSHYYIFLTYYTTLLYCYSTILTSHITLIHCYFIYSIYIICGLSIITLLIVI